MNIASCAASPRRAVVLAVGSWGDVAPLAGVAQWCFPTAHDQADNSFRLAQLGVGETFSARVTPARLRQAAQQALDGRWAPGCAQGHARLAAQPDALATLVDEVLG